MSFRSSLDAKPPSKSTILVLLCMYIYIYSILRTVIVLTPLFPAPSLPQGHVFRIANTQPHSTRRDMHPFPLLANNRTIRHGPPHHASRMLMAPRSALIIHATHTEEAEVAFLRSSSKIWAKMNFLFHAFDSISLLRN